MTLVLQLFGWVDFPTGSRPNLFGWRLYSAAGQELVKTWQMHRSPAAAYKQGMSAAENIWKARTV